MKKNLLIAMLLVVSSNYGQIQFLNEETNEPVSNVKIFDQEGEILDISNSKGIIEPKNYKLSEKDTLNIFHSNFIVKYLPYKELLAKDFFF